MTMTKIKTLSAALIAATLIAPVASAGTLTVTLEDIKKTKESGSHAQKLYL